MQNLNQASHFQNAGPTVTHAAQLARTQENRQLNAADGKALAETILKDGKVDAEEQDLIDELVNSPGRVDLTSGAGESTYFDPVGIDFKTSLLENVMGKTPESAVSKAVDKAVNQMQYGAMDWSVSDGNVNNALNALDNLNPVERSVALKKLLNDHPVEAERLMTNLLETGDKAKFEKLVDMFSSPELDNSTKQAFMKKLSGEGFNAFMKMFGECSEEKQQAMIENMGVEKFAGKLVYEQLKAKVGSDTDTSGLQMGLKALNKLPSKPPVVSDMLKLFDAALTTASKTMAQTVLGGIDGSGSANENGAHRKLTQPAPLGFGMSSEEAMSAIENMKKALE